jgi:hypothetical protein
MDKLEKWRVYEHPFGGEFVFLDTDLAEEVHEVIEAALGRGVAVTGRRIGRIRFLVAVVDVELIEDVAC